MILELKEQLDTAHTTTKGWKHINEDSFKGTKDQKKKEYAKFLKSVEAAKKFFAEIEDKVLKIDFQNDIE